MNQFDPFAFPGLVTVETSSINKTLSCGQNVGHFWLRYELFGMDFYCKLDLIR